MNAITSTSHGLSVTDKLSQNQDNIRVMIVDDSVVVRGLVSRWIEEEDGLVPVGKFSNGQKALDGAVAADPDIIILDIEMPVMDGMQALPEILKLVPKAKVIMASTLTQRNAEISLNALSLGAADYVPKPVSNSGVTTSTEFRRDLLDKVRALGRAQKSRSKIPLKRVEKSNQTISKIVTNSTSTAKYNLRPFSNVRPRVLVIGSSTGGPPAVMKVLEDVAPVLKYLPVLITQHMPATFTGIFAGHLGRGTGVETREGQNGDPLKAGTIYVAPGGKHMIIERDGAKPIIRLTDGPDINFCKPAVDPLFDSAAKVYGAATLAVVFTGMGADGAKGAVKIADAGGSVIAQDEASSVVWGMPGATAKAGACSVILPLNQIASKLTQLIQGSSK